MLQHGKIVVYVEFLPLKHIFGLPNLSITSTSMVHPTSNF